mgnify:CR=1 FL=1
MKISKFAGRMGGCCLCNNGLFLYNLYNRYDLNNKKYVEVYLIEL